MTTAVALSILAGIAAKVLLSQMWRNKTRTGSSRNSTAWSLAGWGIAVVLSVAVWVVAVSKLAG